MKPRKPSRICLLALIIASDSARVSGHPERQSRDPDVLPLRFAPRNPSTPLGMTGVIAGEAILRKISASGARSGNLRFQSALRSSLLTWKRSENHPDTSKNETGTEE